MRGLAACGVLVSHAGQPFFSSGLFWTPPIGHQMVVIFFVLSGFVMSHAVTKVRDDWKAYSVARFSRIASVAYPALIFTVVCDCLGRLANPEFYESVARLPHYEWRVLLNATFLSQSGHLSASPGSNTPFWSLAYEVWYYIMLGVWVFVRPVRWRVVALIFVGAVAGQKILLLLPVWLLGFVAYRMSCHCKMSRLMSVLIFGVSALMLCSIFCGVVRPWGDLGHWESTQPLFFSTGYVSDYQLGLLTASHFYAADRLFSLTDTRWLFARLDTVIRFVADRSFSLYAYHMPLLYLVSVTVPYNKSSSIEVLMVMLLVIGIVTGLHWVTERNRRAWHRFAESALRRL